MYNKDIDTIHWTLQATHRRRHYHPCRFFFMRKCSRESSGHCPRDETILGCCRCGSAVVVRRTKSTSLLAHLLPPTPVPCIPGPLLPRVQFSSVPSSGPKLPYRTSGWLHYTVTPLYEQRLGFWYPHGERLFEFGRAQRAQKCSRLHFFRRSVC